MNLIFNILLILLLEVYWALGCSFVLFFVRLASKFGTNISSFHQRSSRRLNCWIIHSNLELKTQSQVVSLRRIHTLLLLLDGLDKSSQDHVFYKRAEHNLVRRCNSHLFNFRPILGYLYRGHSTEDHIKVLQ